MTHKGKNKLKLKSWFSKDNLEFFTGLLSAILNFFK